MLNLLVETKNEYTTHLTNILTPLIFQGLQSIYNESKNIVNNNGETHLILKIFQSCLKSILTWNTVTIEKATSSIMTSSQSYEWLNDLIKATLKSNLMVLLYNPSCKNQTKIDPLLYQSIKTTDFIHRVYIECARELWNNPYLMYHDYPPIEIKRNQRDCMIIIKDSIKEALRKLLPVKHILQVYLGEDINYNQVDETFDKAISEVEENYLPKLINKDLSITNQILSEKSQGSIILDIINNTPNSVISQKNTKQSDTSELKNNMSSYNYKKINSKNMSSDNYKKINSKNIVNDSKAMALNKPYEISSITSDLSNQNIDNPIVAKLNNSDVNINNKITNNNNIDDKIKKILKNDLAIDSDNIDTSLTYDNYQEIFSNSYENK
jgi:hypothetical protein